jgi:hypothetical protein
MGSLPACATAGVSAAGGTDVQVITRKWVGGVPGAGFTLQAAGCAAVEIWGGRCQCMLLLVPALRDRVAAVRHWHRPPILLRKSLHAIVTASLNVLSYPGAMLCLSPAAGIGEAPYVVRQTAT